MKDLEKIVVKNTTMHAKTVPVRIIMDGWYPGESGLDYERFILVETDGYYIVTRDIYGESIYPLMEVKCFMYEKDALDFLELHGIERSEIHE